MRTSNRLFASHTFECPVYPAVMTEPFERFGLLYTMRPDEHTDSLVACVAIPAEWQAGGPKKLWNVQLGRIEVPRSALLVPAVVATLRRDGWRDLYQHMTVRQGRYRPALNSDTDLAAPRYMPVVATIVIGGHADFPKWLQRTVLIPFARNT